MNCSTNLQNCCKCCRWFDFFWLLAIPPFSFKIRICSR